MDFKMGFPQNKYQHDSIMVVVDTLTKVSHFILVQSTFGTTQVANFFMKEILSLHGIPKMIISNRDTKFTSNFYKKLFG